MEFYFTEEEENFREEVRDFIKEELPSDWSLPSTFLVFGDDKHWRSLQQILRKVAERGWLTLGWPEEYGGQPHSYFKRLILAEEMAYHGLALVDFGVKMVAPVLFTHGTEEQKRKHLPPIARTEVVWCQGFSEPDAGSDLASLRTQARKEGDYFFINGQKVWITGAHRANWCFLLARTDPDLPRHRGLGAFLVNMETPGITVYPVENILGENCFCEVYFDDVKVPKENLVGGENKGFYVVQSFLGAERSGIEYSAESRRFLETIINFVREDKDEDTALLARHDIRLRLAEMAAQIEVERWLAYRVAWLQSKGEKVECEAAMSKLYGSELMQRCSFLGMQIMGLYRQLVPGSKWAPLQGWVEQWHMSNIGRTIGAGTSEIQRLLIATRGLDLPR